MINHHQAGVHSIEVFTFPAYNPAAGCNHSICNHYEIFCAYETWLRWGPYTLILHSHNLTSVSREPTSLLHTQVLCG